MEKKKVAMMQVSQKAAVFRDGKLLILETAYFPGFWDLPGGRLDEGEFHKEAFERELEEELGWKDGYQVIGVADYGVWITKRGLPVCMIINLVETTKDSFTLSEEHSNFRWIDESEIEDFDFVWNTEESHQMIHRCFDLLKKMK